MYIIISLMYKYINSKYIFLKINKRHRIYLKNEGKYTRRCLKVNLCTLFCLIWYISNLIIRSWQVDTLIWSRLLVILVVLTVRHWNKRTSKHFVTKPQWCIRKRTTACDNLINLGEVPKHNAEPCVFSVGCWNGWL